MNTTNTLAQHAASLTGMTRAEWTKLRDAVERIFDSEARQFDRSQPFPSIQQVEDELNKRDELTLKVFREMNDRAKL